MNPYVSHESADKTRVLNIWEYGIHIIHSL